ncbi:MAG: YhfC family glutamic-type intramembrane protease [Lacunisphaera sp.]|nr:YhfC family glutamic-type intramembrane protease [Lacunisphaera sp.]
MDYLVYFVGPFFLGALGARYLNQRFRVFFVGFLAFFLAWIVMQTIATLASRALHLSESAFLYGLIVSVLAGLVEESTRYFVFRRFAPFKTQRDWNASTMYALGHHGMEVVIVGLSLLLTVLVVKYKPDAISDPALLRQCRALVALGEGTKLYSASERLFVGLLIHTCFSGVVMLAVARGQVRYVFLAGLWHFAHNLVGFNLHRLPHPALAAKAWIVVILIGYTFLALRIYHALRKTATPPPVSPAAGQPSKMLPGRCPD